MNFIPYLLACIAITINYNNESSSHTPQRLPTNKEQKYCNILGAISIDVPLFVGYKILHYRPRQI